MPYVYLDNSATTKPCDAAINAAMNMFTQDWGNPSSLHTLGINAECRLNEAREKVARLLGCSEREVYFTSGGTEANNIAIMGAVKARKRLGKRIVTTSIEHSSVYETMQQLEKDGYEVIYLTPQDNRITTQMLDEAITPDTILVSMMAVNNETGLILPIQDVKKIIKRKKAPALFHCDAVQAFGKMPIKLAQYGIDLTSVSGHKIHAPKGIGALYVSRNARILPIMYGGEQQSKLRPGTECAPLACAFGAACDQAADISGHFAHAQQLRDHLLNRLSEHDGICINSTPEALPYVINISALGIRSETMLHYLASKNVYVSSGSACSKGKKSRVLAQLGYSDSIVDSALRISFCRDNTVQDIDTFVDAFFEGIDCLQKVKK